MALSPTEPKSPEEYRQRLKSILGSWSSNYRENINIQQQQGGGTSLAVKTKAKTRLLNMDFIDHDDGERPTITTTILRSSSTASSSSHQENNDNSGSSGSGHHVNPPDDDDDEKKEEDGGSLHHRRRQLEEKEDASISPRNKSNVHHPHSRPKPVTTTSPTKMQRTTSSPPPQTKDATVVEAMTTTTTETTMTSSPSKPSTEWIHADHPAGQDQEEPSSTSFSKEWIDQWTQLGLAKYVSLPMICVLGDTSSGKSSVLSSLIGLELPSASTLTTKCPVLIQLLKSTSSSQEEEEGEEEEEATIRIQWHENMHSKSPHSSPRHVKRVLEQQNSGGGMILNSHPPPPPPPIWKPQMLRGNDLNRIPSIIQKAQQIILGYRDTLISPDVICLTIKSSNIKEELTVVDLPGCVQYQHTQDSSLLSQVEQVVLNYVHNPRSILLPVLAAPTNIYNSKVLQWTRQVDPTTRRTIPVLTKPDLIDPGSESDVLELLLQSSTANNSLKSDGGGGSWQHGVYMVKNRGQALLDQNATIEQGLQEEAEFFATTSPWNTLLPENYGEGHYPNILGVPALRETLANVLWQVMKDSLPDIIQEIQQQYDTTQKQLEEMGTIYNTKSEQRKYYHSITQTLVNQVSTSLSGKKGYGSRVATFRKRNSSGNSLGRSGKADGSSTNIATSGASKLHTACGDFFTAIHSGSLATISSLVEGAHVLVTTHGSGDDVPGELVHVDSQQRYACVDCSDDKDHNTDVLFDGVDYMADDPDFEIDEVWSDGSRVFIGRSGGQFDSLRKLPLERIRTDPSWLVDKMDQFRTDDLACFVNVHMFQQIVADFVIEDWAPPCYELIRILEQLISATLKEALEAQLQQTRFPMLRSMVEKTCQNVAKKLVDTAKTQVQEHLEMEEQHPYTQDQVLLQAMNETRLTTLQQDLQLQLRLDQEGVVYDTQAIQTILDRVFEKHKRQNWMAEQMENVLSCYGKVATQRVLDRTPQICWQTYRSLPTAISEELGCVTDEILETCLWESPESREKFHRLSTKLHELQVAMKSVESMRTKQAH